ncbi:TetR/AcrR family transcriptional regulator [Actinophytocola sp.]|uniref:TetR/AcrR family transcriptional regulator n=1 Tax=Actinophytocola sp. TaxID=1872138 RepID=UPI0025B9DED4|nr:TetR/AcrR family transcriptional regulator [Actinophytocola sp.]
MTPDQIIKAALRIADVEADLDQLTVRRLASELNVGTMTLYSYFRGKENILDGMADHVLGRMPLPDEPDDTPADAIRMVARAFLAMMREHPSVVRIFSTRVTDSRTALRGAMEAVLDRLVAAGIPGELAVRCYGFLITYAIGFVSYQIPRSWGGDPDSDEELAEARRQRVHFYKGLPATEFPHMVDLADTLVDLPSDAQYMAGVEAFVQTVEAALKNTR